MTNRPIFIPIILNEIGVEEKPVEFKWHSGFSIVQKQKSIRDLHYSAKKIGINNILEISSKSEDDIGIALSAFNLIITTKKKNNKLTVETAFQGSKVFENGGPYKDLFGTDSIKAKKDIRLKESGNLIEFDFFGKKFPLEPLTFFYDWIYINALVQNAKLAEAVLEYDGYSDIEFNPKKSINCQAHAVALYVSLKKAGKLTEALSSPEEFLRTTQKHYSKQKRNMIVQNGLL